MIVYPLVGQAMLSPACTAVVLLPDGDELVPEPSLLYAFYYVPFIFSCCSCTYDTHSARF